MRVDDFNITVIIAIRVRVNLSTSLQIHKTSVFVGFVEIPASVQ